MGDLIKLNDRDKLVIKYSAKHGGYKITELVLYGEPEEGTVSLIARAKGIIKGLE